MLFSVGTGIAIAPLIDGTVHGLVIMTGAGIAIAGLGWILDDYVWPALAIPRQSPNAPAVVAPIDHGRADSAQSLSC
jgi:hypothetical protein